MAQIQAVWNRFNPRERLIGAGAALVVVGWLISLLDYGFGTSTLALIGAIAALLILYLKYTNSSINWPAPVALILIVIAAVVALLAVIDALPALRFGFGMFTLGAIVSAIGGVVMAWGAWQEYQVEKPALPNFSNATAGQGTAPSSPAAATATPTATEPPAAAPPRAAAPPPADTDDTTSR